MPKTQEELEQLKKQFEELKKIKDDLSLEELNYVTGGCGGGSEPTPAPQPAPKPEPEVIDNLTKSGVQFDPSGNWENYLGVTGIPKCCPICGASLESLTLCGSGTYFGEDRNLRDCTKVATHRFSSWK